MPEYLAPGVYVEETSFRSKSIEGVSTSTAGFIGPARFGPTKGVPELLTSFSDFERIYGGLGQMEYPKGSVHNYLAHGVRNFFEEGGKRLYVARVYKEGNGTGVAKATIPEQAADDEMRLEVRARYPGAAGNFEVTFVVKVGQNIKVESEGRAQLRGARDYDVVWIEDFYSPLDSSVGGGRLFWLEPYFDEVNQLRTFRLRRTDPGKEDPEAILVTQLNPHPESEKVRVITVTVTVQGSGRFEEPRTWLNLSFHPEHRQALTRVFAPQKDADRATMLFTPIEIEAHELGNGALMAETLLSQPSPSRMSPLITILDTLSDEKRDEKLGDAARTYQMLLKGGSDGERPEASEYEGDDGESEGIKSGLRAFEDLEDISIVAAPGSTFGYQDGYRKDGDTILRHLISHCERMRYRIAVLDSGDSQLLSQVRSYRGRLDSKYAALYYPWVTILDPVTEQEIRLPPSGFVTGIYARNDIEHGVHKAPANEVVRSAIGFEFMLNKAQQDVLNPEGINCFRFFEGRGYRLWGARTISSDPEWKYVNLRRYFAYLERSIDKGTQWVVFRNNSEILWANVRRTIDDFLFNEWKSGHLMGEKPQEAYFVRCDRSTMTQNDIDNGRLVCLIGVAAVRPAEFVIFRIGQWTADRRT